MTKNSNISQTKRSKVFQATWLVSIAFAGLVLLSNREIVMSALSWAEPSSLFICAFLLNITVRYVHYYMDRCLYRMKDARTRALIGPLLVAKSVPARSMAEEPSIAIVA